ncbi:MAG: hypothetical protein V7607_1731 [Solirubrobacteraceae bacterium]
MLEIRAIFVGVDDSVEPAGPILSANTLIESLQEFGGSSPDGRDKVAGVPLKRAVWLGSPGALAKQGAVDGDQVMTERLRSALHGLNIATENRARRTAQINVDGTGQKHDVVRHVEVTITPDTAASGVLISAGNADDAVAEAMRITAKSVVDQLARADAAGDRDVAGGDSPGAAAVVVSRGRESQTTGVQAVDERGERTVDEPGKRTVDEPGDRTVDAPGDRTVDEPSVRIVLLGVDRGTGRLLHAPPKLRDINASEVEAFAQAVFETELRRLASAEQAPARDEVVRAPAVPTNGATIESAAREQPISTPTVANTASSPTPVRGAARSQPEDRRARPVETDAGAVRVSSPSGRGRPPNAAGAGAAPTQRPRIAEVDARAAYREFLDEQRAEVRTLADARDQEWVERRVSYVQRWLADKETDIAGVQARLTSLGPLAELRPDRAPEGLFVQRRQDAERDRQQRPSIAASEQSTGMPGAPRADRLSLRDKWLNDYARRLGAEREMLRRTLGLSADVASSVDQRVGVDAAQPAAPDRPGAEQVNGRPRPGDAPNLSAAGSTTQAPRRSARPRARPILSRSGYEVPDPLQRYRRFLDSGHISDIEQIVERERHKLRDRWQAERPPDAEAWLRAQAQALGKPPEPPRRESQLTRSLEKTRAKAQDPAATEQLNASERQLRARRLHLDEWVKDNDVALAEYVATVRAHRMAWIERAMKQCEVKPPSFVLDDLGPRPDSSQAELQAEWRSLARNRTYDHAVSAMCRRDGMPMPDSRQRAHRELGQSIVKFQERRGLSVPGATGIEKTAGVGVGS